ncbi:unnamed protein product, partial [Gongylonema pulchrum]|uniref:Uncharacterized protein n=1 Tax=Gongylonema pulchrum TaxID=637853 RepID=A0A183DJ19_9BILA
MAQESSSGRVPPASRRPAASNPTFGRKSTGQAGEVRQQYPLQQLCQQQQQQQCPPQQKSQIRKHMDRSANYSTSANYNATSDARTRAVQPARAESSVGTSFLDRTRLPQNGFAAATSHSSSS